MLLFTCSSALTIPTMKRLLQQQREFKCRREVALNGLSSSSVMSTVKDLQTDVRKYLVMALTSNPQYVLSRSHLGGTTGMICMFQSIVLIEAFFRSRKPGAVPACTNQSSSDYKWSIPFILFSQIIGIVGGALAPVVRFSIADLISRPNDSNATGEHQRSSDQRPEGAGCSCKVERYWVQKFVDWKDRPLLVYIRSRRCQKLIHGTKHLVIEFMKGIHVGVVVFSKFVGSNAWADLPEVFRPVVQLISKPADKFFTTIFATLSAEESVAEDSAATSHPAAARIHLRNFVLHLEDEDRFVDRIMHFCNFNADMCIKNGRQKPRDKVLTALLRKVLDVVPQGFMEAAHSNRRSNQVDEEPPNCWVLSLVTLTSIALAIPCTDQGAARIKDLLQEGVNEGLKYVWRVDTNLDTDNKLVKVREAAYVVWSSVNLRLRWLDMDLADLASEGTEPKNIIESLKEKGRGYAGELEGNMVNELGSMESGLTVRPLKAIAGRSMLEICTAILRNYSNVMTSSADADRLFEWLHVLISDMLGACLTNLPRALYMQCYNSCMEAKEDGVRDAAFVLGEAENILEALRTDQSNPADMVIYQSKYIAHWRSFMPNWSNFPDPASHGNA